ncbi:MAG: ATP-binding protein, partial [Desulfurococcales archaeon]|nr:ATP-binding protein [Desulfurococcales archaeon]
MLLNLLEYPPAPYERIVVLVGSSEGASKRRVGRHRWAIMLAVWSMQRDGFRMLYEQVPGDKPPFEDVWMLTGGNPGYLARLYRTGWDASAVVRDIMLERGLEDLVDRLTQLQLRALEEAIRDPNALVYMLRAAKSEGERRELESLIYSLAELNLVFYRMPQ